MPISDFQSSICLSKIIQIFLIFFLWRGMFFVIVIFWKLQFLILIFRHDAISQVFQITFVFVFKQLPGQYSADVSVEEEVGNYLTAEVPSGSGRRGSFRGSRISSVGHSHSGSMDLMETGSLPSGFR